jgi:cell division protein FtsB
MSHWTKRIEKKLNEIDEALAAARASIASTIEAAEGETEHYRREADRLRAEVSRLREKQGPTIESTSEVGP